MVLPQCSKSVLPTLHRQSQKQPGGGQHPEHQYDPHQGGGQKIAEEEAEGKGKSGLHHAVTKSSGARRAWEHIRKDALVRALIHPPPEPLQDIQGHEPPVPPAKVQPPRLVGNADQGDSHEAQRPDKHRGLLTGQPGESQGPHGGDGGGDGRQGPNVARPQLRGGVVTVHVPIHEGCREAEGQVGKGKEPDFYVRPQGDGGHGLPTDG
mmetsp:Transcript_37674/g.82401  ORF Transcript_37674/g.82401 Transcript_37674/m.82401 type:complete len:208 (-) Transcript_37674:271-894(-)